LRKTCFAINFLKEENANKIPMTNGIFAALAKIKSNIKIFVIKFDEDLPTKHTIHYSKA
jgi:hypothetical protein